MNTAVLAPSSAKILDPNNFPLKIFCDFEEAISPDIYDKWAAQLRIYNTYGPTERTRGATIKRLEPQN